MIRCAIAWTCLCALVLHLSANLYGQSKTRDVDLLQAIPEEDDQAGALRFDFRWANQLHALLDQFQARNLAGMEEVVQSWLAIESKVSKADRFERSVLVSLFQSPARSLTLDGAHLRKSIQELLETLNNKDQRNGYAKPLSFTMLFALEQICIRTHDNNGHWLPVIREELKKRSQMTIAQYRDGAISVSEVGFYLASALSRVDDDPAIADLLDEVMKLHDQRKQEPATSLVSLHADRLARLAEKDMDRYRARAQAASRRLCEYLLKKPSLLRTHPLALAKGYYTLAWLATTASDTAEQLTATLDACDAVPAIELSPHPRLIREARLAVKLDASASDDEVIRLLLEYRTAKLRSAALLMADRISLIAPSGNGRLNLQWLQSSLEKLRDLQAKTHVRESENLVTLFNLAAVLRRRAIGSFAEILDAAMLSPLMAAGQDDPPPPLRRLIMETQLSWIESRVMTLSNSSMERSSQGLPGALNQSVRALPTVAGAIASLKHELAMNRPGEASARHDDLRVRLQRAELTNELANNDYDLIVKFIRELQAANLGDQDVQFLVDILTVQLEKQTGNLLRAKALAEQNSLGQSTS